MQDGITSLPIEDVYPNPRHYREVTEAAVRTLAESIAVIGQIEPITVFRDGDVYIIDSGHHRHAAMKRLGLAEIRAVVIDDQTESDSAKTMVAANLHFEATELEKSRGTQLMLTTGVRPDVAAALIGEKPERVCQAAKGLTVAQDYAEDMSLDRLIACGEFADDEESVKRLLTCYEKDFARIYGEMQRARKTDAAYAECAEIVEASGVWVVDDLNPEGYRYIDRSKTAIEGAAAARICRNDWNGTCDIIWYRLDNDEDDEKQREADAARERREQEATEREAEHTRRMEFLRDYLNNDLSTLSNALRDFASTVWDGGISVDSRDIEETPLDSVKGFLPRVYATILGKMEDHAQQAFGGGWWEGQYAQHSVSFLDALKACGYEFSQYEAAKHTHLSDIAEGVDDE